jgi:hypothetical protein
MQYAELHKRFKEMISTVKFKPSEPISKEVIQKLERVYILPRKGRKHLLVKIKYKHIDAISRFKKICKDKIKKKKMIQSAQKIQAIWRGFLCRSRRLPTFLHICQKAVSDAKLVLNKSTKDGRVNSTIDEGIVIEHLQTQFGERIKKAPERHWFDMMIFDYSYGWIPVNVKTTTMTSPDNVGNLALLLYSLTSYSMEFHKSYKNGIVAPIFTRHIRERKINQNQQRDYFFLVVNKKKTDDVVVNSLRGLKQLTHNNNNLPFQVNWSMNRKFHYHMVKEMAIKVIKTMRKPKKTWAEIFLEEVREMPLFEEEEDQDDE